MREPLTTLEINESIQYAALIQSALLPDIIKFQKCFPDSYILFRPLDLVSGDFYWFQKRKNRIAVVAADCTGHGVPGAFMSVLGISYLNQITSTTIPLSNKILDILREYVMKALNQDGHMPVRREGIDMTVCVFDLEKKHIEISGAMNPVFYFKNNNLFQIKGDRMPVGIHALEEESFSRQIIPFSEVDWIYLFSDGYADQFGGPEGKKLKSQGFRNLLTDVKSLSGEDQHKTLLIKLYEWIGQNEQIDDILLIGINLQSITYEAQIF